MQIITSDNINILGMMSGTSGDGIDAALVEFSPDFHHKLLWFDSVRFTARQHERIHRLMSGCTCAEALLGGVYVASLYAMAFEKIFERHDIQPNFIAAHGQTILHHPDKVYWDEIALNGSLQLLDGATLAQKTGIDVICNFRAADMAAGGNGAPLVPFADSMFFAKDMKTDRIIVNIGGIANITVLATPDGKVKIAGDTGPGNMLMDAAVARFSKGSATYDADGAWAARGKTDHRVLDLILADSYFARSLPKSTGRELFGAHRLSEFLDMFKQDPSREDVLSTLLDVTVESIAQAIEQAEIVAKESEIYVAGGGANNSELMRRLSIRLNGRKIFKTDKLGVPAMARESMAFAALGWAFLKRVSANPRSATGASAKALLGQLHQAPIR